MVAAKHVPLIAALILLAGGGFLLLEKADKQARDTTRKHHLQDIEGSLYFARQIAGSYPPYSQPTWCGFLNAPENSEVRGQLEAALRAQHEQYSNPDKPYPFDPLADDASSAVTYDYFYWKRSPTMFELYAVLEQEKSGERNSFNCPDAPGQYFDYGIASIEREYPGRTIKDGIL